MNNNIMSIHIGKAIQEKVKKNNVSRREIMLAFKCSDEKINRMYHSSEVKTNDLMKWSLLLNYNFFELYNNAFNKMNKNGKVRQYNELFYDENV